LKELGYLEGRDIAIEARWAGGKIERLEPLAVEMVARNPAVIATATSAAVAALMKATSSIPIVFAAAGNPVEQGFVSSLGRPGGNVTGMALHFDLNAKIIEIIREALPAARRLGVLVHDSDPVYKILRETAETSARHFRFEPVVVSIARAEEIEHAFKEIADRKVDALLPPISSLFIGNADRIAQLALRARLPLFSTHHQLTTGGGLLSYGTQLEENYRRAAALVDKILRGTRPGELPVELPERFQLVINIKTAKEIGVRLSPTTILRADRVIE
jgi:putative ABC transport system substrate-binding protein